MESPHRPPKLESALALHENGLCVIPLEEPQFGQEKSGKSPAVKRWKPFQSMRPSETDIRRWWSKNPNFNIGVPMGPVSGFVGFDADSEEAVDLIRRCCSETPFQVITHKGRHFYFRDSGIQLTNSVKINGKPIDARFHGSYLVGPGSEHWTGRIYTLLNELTPEMLREVPPFDPSWITIEKRSFAASTVNVEPTENRYRLICRAEKYGERIEPAVEGQGGSNKMMWFVGSMIQKFRLSYEEALPIIQAYNERCIPPFSESEIEHKIQSAIANREKFVRSRIADVLEDKRCQR